MIVVDENFQAFQRDQLRRWRIRFRHIGTDLAEQGLKDPQIVPLLRRLTRPTLFSWDRHFCDRDLRHRAYCLVFVDVHRRDLAQFTRRFLRHPGFRAFAQRQGSVIRIGYEAVHVWRLGTEREEEVPWPR